MIKITACALALAAAFATGGARADDASPLRPLRTLDAPAPTTLVSVADPACEGGIGFRLLREGANASSGTFVVPHGRAYVADGIRWTARSSGFDSPIERVAFELSDAGGAGPASGTPRAIVAGTRIGGGEAQGARAWKSGIAFGSGASLCGNVRTNNALARAQAGEARAVVHGRLVDAATIRPQ